MGKFLDIFDLNSLRILKNIYFTYLHIKLANMAAKLFRPLGMRGCILDAATSSGILKAKQKLGRTFNSDKLGGIAFTKISKLTMCSA